MNSEKTYTLAKQKIEKEITKLQNEIINCNEQFDKHFKIGQPLQAQKWLARANALKDCIGVLKECLAYVS